MQANFDEHIKKVYAADVSGYEAPEVSQIKARRYISAMRGQEADFVGRIAMFLNMRIRLYDAVIAFVVIWLAVILFSGGDKAAPAEKHNQPYVSYLGAAPNSTAPACIQTYVLKK